MQQTVSMGSERVLANAPISEEERKTRIELAACYRLARREGWDELIYNHISARVPGPEHHFLINPFGLAFEEVTASNLVKVDLDGKIIGNAPYPINAAGFTIHSADSCRAARSGLRHPPPHRGGYGALDARQRAPAAVADGDVLPWQHRVSRLRRHRPQSRRAPASDPRSRRQIGDDPAQPRHAGGWRAPSAKPSSPCFCWRKRRALSFAPWRAARSWSPPRRKPSASPRNSAAAAAAAHNMPGRRWCAASTARTRPTRRDARLALRLNHHQQAEAEEPSEPRRQRGFDPQ